MIQLVESGRYQTPECVDGSVYVYVPVPVYWFGESAGYGQKSEILVHNRDGVRFIFEKPSTGTELKKAYVRVFQAFINPTLRNIVK